MTNEQLWRALGWEREELFAGHVHWRRNGGSWMHVKPPDYENDDAAAVALLEELRQRGHEVVVYADEQGWGMENTPYPTFREAVVAGAAALLGVQG